MRIFLGIPISEEAAGTITAAYPSFKGLRAKFVEKKNLHVTLNFLGEANERTVKNLLQSLEKALEGTEGFEIGINGIKTFPSSQAARVIWAGIEKGSGAIREIFRKTEAIAVSQGFKKEDREFMPHITMARLKQPQDVSGYLRGIRINAVCAAERVVLYKSDLTQQGPVYSELSGFKLKI